MSGRIEITKFDKISGNILGVALAFFTVKGKQEKRICHAYLTTGGADISLSIPKFIPEDQIGDLLAIVGEFYNKVKTND